MADRTDSKPPRPAKSKGNPPAKNPPAKKPPEDAPEKPVIKKAAGIKGSFFLVLVAGLLWGFMSGVNWAKLQDFYAQGYSTFNNAWLVLTLPFLMMFFTLSLFWLIRTPRRREVKPMAIASMLVWLVYFFWEAMLTSRF